MTAPTTTVCPRRPPARTGLPVLVAAVLASLLASGCSGGAAAPAPGPSAAAAQASGPPGSDLPTDPPADESSDVPSDVPSDPPSERASGPADGATDPSVAAEVSPGITTTPLVDVLGNQTGVEVGAVVAGADLDVVQAWYDYVDLRMDVLSTRELDEARLSDTSVGVASDDLRAFHAERVADSTRDVGPLRLDVRMVVVDGDTAMLFDCLGVFAGLVDDNGMALEMPQGPTPYRADLVRSGDGWVVSSYERQGSCFGG